MKITWVTRSFLDYRIPVFEALDKICGHNLTLIYYEDVVPERVRIKIQKILGDRAIARKKEFRIGNRPKIDNAEKTGFALRIPISFGLVRQLLKSKPDVIISDGFMQWTYAALIARAFKKIPHVMCYERTAHVERNAHKIRILYRKFVSRWIDAIDCNGKLCSEYVKSLGFDSSRITEGHMAADVHGLIKNLEKIGNGEIQGFRNSLGLKEIVILYVGRLYQLKGVMELLDAWQIYKNEYPNNKVSLVYVGGGKQESEMREKIKIEQIPDVTITGSVNYDTIAKYYKIADCFIIATKGDNWSLVVPEAMACGLPIASSIYNGCWPELVTTENGWTFDSMNKMDIVRVLKNIVDNHNHLKEMGNVSRKIIANHTPYHAANSIIDAAKIALKHCHK